MKAPFFFLMKIEYTNENLPHDRNFLFESNDVVENLFQSTDHIRCFQYQLDQRPLVLVLMKIRKIFHQNSNSLFIPFLLRNCAKLLSMKMITYFYVHVL